MGLQRTAAARSGHLLEVLRWAIEAGCAWDTYTVVNAAAEAGDLGALHAVFSDPDTRQEIWMLAGSDSPRVHGHVALWLRMVLFTDDEDDENYEWFPGLDVSEDPADEDQQSA